MFQTDCAAYEYSLYTQPACLWAWLITLAYMALLVHTTLLYVHACNYIYQLGEQ